MKVLYIIVIVLLVLFCVIVAIHNGKQEREIKKLNKQWNEKRKQEADNARAQEQAQKTKQKAHSGDGAANSDYMAGVLHDLAHRADK